MKEEYPANQPELHHLSVLCGKMLKHIRPAIFYLGKRPNIFARQFSI
ncbi:hypothetical protein [Prolixibacter sp. SD074]|nr:hypothetical protein [Prolixibacter sp. SD074]